MKSRFALVTLGMAAAFLGVPGAHPAAMESDSEVFRYNVNDGNLDPVTDETGGGTSVSFNRVPTR